MELQGKTVAVTGASGMLGPYLCRALAEAGAKVRGVVRNPKKSAFLEREGVELALADLAQPDALTEAFRGCDAVVSNAALYRMLNQRFRDNYLANKEGTENVYEAAARAGAGRVVHISTFGVYRWRLGRRFDESSPVIDGAKKQGGAYRATKQLSEALAFSISAKHGLQTTALRPAGIYGARDHNTMPYLRLWLNAPLVLAPQLSFPFVYAGDVADAVVGALRNDDSAGKVYLTAGQNATLYELAVAYRKARGAKNLIVPIPGKVGLYADCSKAEREIGFRMRPHEEGLRATLEADARYLAADGAA